MSFDVVTHIAAQVKHQFPAFYREQGPNFIAFLQAYYEWMEQDGQVIDQSRKLFDTRDIDFTADQFLDHFKAKFMANLPKEIIGNQRLFQKHILELYRSKGSLAGLKLLFRLLYNEDVDVYVPSYDIFKASDNIWKQPHYLEVTNTETIWNYQGKMITGATSGATAIVENVEQKAVNGRTVTIINLSNIAGDFRVGEIIIYDNISVIGAPIILGSPVTITVISGGLDFKVGDILTDNDSDRRKPLRVVVSDVYNAIGTISFSLSSPGTYYSMQATANVTGVSNTSGFGANVQITSISDTFPFAYSTDLLADVASVNLDATVYGMSNTSANSGTEIIDSIGFDTVIVGKIATIATVNPGVNYDGDVLATFIDPYTSTRGIWDEETQGFSGQNGRANGVSTYGQGVIGSARVYDAGVSYSLDGQQITMHSEANTNQIALISVGIGGIGKSEGYFDDTRSFASSDKYLFDGHYYQDFSYVIKSSRVLENYLDILKQVMHVAGNRVYGTVVLTQTYNIDLHAANNWVTQS